MKNKEAIKYLIAPVATSSRPSAEYLRQKEAYELAIKALKAKTEPQGKCKTCIHRDPEDKKCDCGELERQGCLFPVSDNYYCKYYERGAE